MYTPRAVSPTSNLPVMVFFHGGNFNTVGGHALRRRAHVGRALTPPPKKKKAGQGHGDLVHAQGSANLLYEGVFQANRSDVLVVTVNYRLGALGFLVTSGLKCVPGGAGVPRRAM